VYTIDCRESETEYKSNVPFGTTGSGKTARNINLVSVVDILMGQWKTRKIFTCHTSDLHDYWKERFISSSGASDCILQLPFFTFRPVN
jgi:hypothetical protein